MTKERAYDADVIIIGGGPGGAMLGSLLAMDGHRALIIEKDIHPRDHVGESLVPSTNLIFDQIGFLDKMNEEGFAHKPGAAWNGPTVTALEVRGALVQASTRSKVACSPTRYNVERDVMDTLLLRHAHDKGAKVLQGVKVRHVIFEDGRAVGVRASRRGRMGTRSLREVRRGCVRSSMPARQPAQDEAPRPELQPVLHLFLVPEREARARALAWLLALLLPRAEPGLGMAVPAPPGQNDRRARAGQGGLPAVGTDPRGVLLPRLVDRNQTLATR